MLKISRSKVIAISLIFSFILFYSPHLLLSQSVGKGNLVGFIYGEDGITPEEGAVVKARNISTGSDYESKKSDKQGLFMLEGIDEGLYVVGISSKEGDFNVQNLIGIKADETAKVSLALKPQQAEKVKAGKRGVLKKSLLTFFRSPVGIATIIAASAAIMYVIVKLVEAEPEASPFR